MTTIIYARQSLDRDGSGAAIERQLSECRDLADRSGLVVAEEFTDNDQSASKGTRPAFARLLAEIKAGNVSTIVVWHTDRLYRRVRDLVEIVELAETRALRILTVKAGDVDLSTPAGRMLAGMLGHAARYEVEQKGARQVAANVQRAAKGHWQFSRRPYGYKRVAGEVQIVPAEADVLREAYRRYLEGESYYAIVEDFNRRCIPTTDGSTWKISILRERLRNPAYAGIVIYKGQEVGDGDWEPIIDRATWGDYVRMRGRRKRPHDWSNQGKHLLSGLLVCGVCGGRLLSRPEYRMRDGERITTYAYTCKPNWCVSRNLARMDELVSRVIVARFSQPDVLELVKPDDSTAALDAEALELKRRWDDLAGLVASGDLRPEAVREQTAVIKSQLATIEGKIASVRDRSTMTDLALAVDVAARWEALALPKKRSLIQSLLTITVNKQANTRRFDPLDVEIAWIA